MKIYEITEKVAFVNDTNHAIERVKVAAKMCNDLGDTPILYRMFRGGESRGRGAINLMIKINNDSGERKGVKGNHSYFQQKIFDGLGVQHPTQALVTTPGNISGFHGTNFIMIPSSNFKAYWNPEIPDLGSFEGYNDKYKPKDDGFGGRTTLMRPDDYDSTEEVKRAIDGYKQGIPSQNEWNGEVIVDTPFYYMLNLQEFLQKYAGKKNQELVNAPRFARQKGPEYGEIKKELLQTKLKTYRDVGWYLSNPTMNFLKWWKEKESEQEQ
jgi:hypothetical protein